MGRHRKDLRLLTIFFGKNLLLKGKRLRLEQKELESLASFVFEGILDLVHLRASVKLETIKAISINNGLFDGIFTCVYSYVRDSLSW